MPSCNQTSAVYLPPSQGPGADEGESHKAVECFTSSLASNEPAELSFVLVGAEGQHYDAILQALENGNVNYFRQFDRGWGRYENCEEFSLPEPMIPEVDQCAIVEMPAS